MLFFQKFVMLLFYKLVWLYVVIYFIGMLWQHCDISHANKAILNLNCKGKYKYIFCHSP